MPSLAQSVSVSASAPLDLDTRVEQDCADLIEKHLPRLSDALRRCARGECPCQSRICPACCHRREFRLVRRHFQTLESMGLVVHVTLTRYPLKFLSRKDVRETKGMFLRLVRCSEISKRVKGGLANLELTHRGRWKLHIHAIMDCWEAPSKSLLRKKWQLVGGGRQLHLRHLEPDEVTSTFRYSTKCPDLPRTGKVIAQFINAQWRIQPTIAWGSANPRSREQLREVLG